MKIRGPKGPLPTQPGKESDSVKAGKASQVEFKNVLSNQPDPSAAASKVTDLTGIQVICHKITTGEINANQAVDLILDSVIDRRASALSPQKKLELREAIGKILQEDPLLSDKIRNLIPE